MHNMHNELQRNGYQRLLGGIPRSWLGLLVAAGVLEDRQDDVHAVQQIIQEPAPAVINTADLLCEHRSQLI